MQSSWKTGVIFLIGVFLVLLSNGEPLTYLGCYSRESSERPDASAAQSPATSGTDSVLDLWFSPSGAMEQGPNQCVAACKSHFFRYAGVYKQYSALNCLCGSSYGRNGVGECDDCDRGFFLHCGSESAASIYDTGFKVPSAPQQVMLLHKTETVLRISWVKPMATNGPITGYHIAAKGLFSYSHSQSALNLRFWKTSDLEQELHLTGLTPGTQYQISVSAVNSEGNSSATTVTMWTKVGVPDVPPPPKVIRQDTQTMTIEFKSVRNTKGPISTYRIAMIDDSQPGGFNKERGVSWNDSATIGYRHYVAAEFTPDEIPHSGYRRFVIGDRRTYRGFYNGPIPSEGHWHPSLGIVSIMDEFTELSYSATSHDQHTDAVHYKEEPEDINKRARPKKKEQDARRVEVITESSPMVTALWIAIIVSGIVLLICVSAFVVLKTQIFPKRRRSSTSHSTTTERRTENHQLTTREPAYLFPDPTGGYSHPGFINDEDVRSRCLDKLKQVWYVPRNFMDIPDDGEETVELIAKGRYGPVYRSALKTNGAPVTLFSVPPSSFKRADASNKLNMMQEDPEQLVTHLEELVRIEAHENVIKLMGFMEDGESMLFALEHGGRSLKSWLLEYRQFGEMAKSNPVTPYSFLVCAMNIAEALFHLHSFRVTHGHLAACNVLVTNNIEVPKVTGFGLLSSNPLNEQHDFTRWSAVEQFQNRCVKPCDMWSFGVLLWELATLGGTPYHDIRSEDLQKRICRGTRPNQVELLGDPFYQVMLHCWQLDRDERPDFGSLSCSIHELLPRSKENLFISPSFNYPPYIHSYEHIK